MQIDLETLTNIVETEKGVRSLLTAHAYVSCDTLKLRFENFTHGDWGELCVLLNSLKDNCRVLRLSEVEVK